jgi:hypothetical protein
VKVILPELCFEKQQIEDQQKDEKHDAP